ncbi:transcription elongation factor GreA [Aequorivita sp. H23M31]|uniref:Transcription elongation factor GreA n=1 Tax=Aequorivita ciconiae TaxID=2494375 RepID=A0A410G5B8_9FLAO|nr:GreA/GreB family elongation factor [Aequorivita sp. H23M31]QAA82467.1 transcription elongation factor GreA [Aequorivita sp. H23M31]
MSRGFVKEGDQEETPIIPSRAALPEGAINYVTSFGMEQLLGERTDLENQITNLSTENETERRRELAILNGKLDLLQERIASARVLDIEQQRKDEIRFGATVTYKMLANNMVNTIQIVGVDEADLKLKKIAFVAPIVVAMTGHKEGDVIDFKLGGEIRKIIILKIEY